MSSVASRHQRKDLSSLNSMFGRQSICQYGNRHLAVLVHRSLEEACVSSCGATNRFQASSLKCCGDQSLTCYWTDAFAVCFFFRMRSLEGSYISSTRKGWSLEIQQSEMLTGVLIQILVTSCGDRFRSAFHNSMYEIAALTITSPLKHRLPSSLPPSLPLKACSQP